MRIDQINPQITALPDGGFAVTWHSGDNGVNFDIRGRVFDQYGVESAVTFDGGTGDDVFRSGAGNDIFTGGDDNDTAYYRIGDGRDIVDGGTESGGGKDLLDVTGTAAARISSSRSRRTTTTRVNPDYAGTAEILVSSGNDILVEASEIEDIVIHGGGGADTLTVSGSFTGTSLLTSTITFDSGAGNDTLDLRNRDSNHRVVADGSNGTDTVLYDFARAERDVGHGDSRYQRRHSSAPTSRTISPDGPVTDVLDQFRELHLLRRHPGSDHGLQPGAECGRRHALHACSIRFQRQCERDEIGMRCPGRRPIHSRSSRTTARALRRPSVTKSRSSRLPRCTCRISRRM